MRPRSGMLQTFLSLPTIPPGLSPPLLSGQIPVDGEHAPSTFATPEFTPEPIPNFEMSPNIMLQSRLREAAPKPSGASLGSELHPSIPVQDLIEGMSTHKTGGWQAGMKPSSCRKFLYLGSPNKSMGRFQESRPNPTPKPPTQEVTQTVLVTQYSLVTIAVMAAPDP